MGKKMFVLYVILFTLVLGPIPSNSELKSIQKILPAKTTKQKVQPAQKVNVEIKSISKRSLQLEPGGKNVALSIQGVNLNKINGYQILLGKRSVKDIEVTFGSSSIKTLKIKIKAKKTAKPGAIYSLQMLVGKEIIKVPLALKVVKPVVAKTMAKRSNTPQMQPQQAPAPSDGRPEVHQNPSEPAHPAIGTTPVGGIGMQRHDADMPHALQLHDFQITDVYYEGNQHRVSINFTNDEVDGSVYTGPLSCDVQIGNGSVQHLTTQNAGVMYFGTSFTWPEEQSPCYLPISVRINPGNTVPESNSNNNLYQGKLFKVRSGNYRIVLTGNPPEKNIRFLWGHNWSCGSSRNIYEYEVRDNPGYDPDDHFLYADADIWVENCSASPGQVLVEFIYIAYDKVRRDQYQVNLQPGERKKVHAGTPMKIRKKGNYLRVLVNPNYPSGEECRIDLNFKKFPWF